jgi:hypothetical protein
MAMLRVCGHPGCATLTLGALCVEHEVLLERPVRRRRERVVPALAAAPVVHDAREVMAADGRRSEV